MKGRVMRCKKVIRLIPAYHDGELSTRKRELVLHHLRHCARCRAEAERHASVCDLLMRLPQPPQTPDILSGVQRSLDSSAQARTFEKLRYAFTGMLRYQLSGAVAAVMIMCFAAGFYMSWAAAEYRGAGISHTSLPVELFAAAPPETLQDAYIALTQNGG